MCGLPGSGKSTLAARLEGEFKALRFSPDEWILRLGADLMDEQVRTRVETLQWELAQKAIKLGVSVILEFGFWSKAERLAFRNKAAELGAETQLHYLDVPVDELKRRIKLRNTQGNSIDPEQIENWAKDFEVPDRQELGL